MGELLKHFQMRRVLVVAHRQEIIKQISAKFNIYGYCHGIVAPWAEYEPDKPFQVASIQTFHRRSVGQFDILIEDECHHSTAGQYTRTRFLASPEKIVGFTATPLRLDGTPLSDVYDTLVCGPGIKNLQSIGALCGYEIWSPPHDVTGKTNIRMGEFDAKSSAATMEKASTVYGNPVTTWSLRARGKKTIGFACTIDHANSMNERFRKAGISSDVLHSKLSQQEREDVIERFKLGSIHVLWSVDVIGEGFDLPECEAAILMRPTLSLTVYLQQIGRTLRPSNGKDRAIILDHACNSHRHGKPCLDREWSLSSAMPTGKAARYKVLVRVCRACNYVNDLKAELCEYCKQPLYNPRKVIEKEVSLEHESEKARQIPPPWTNYWVGKEYKDLLLFAKKKGYKPGYAYVMAQKLIAYGIAIRIPSWPEKIRLENCYYHGK